MSGHFHHLIAGVLQRALPDLIAVYHFGSFGSAYERLDSDVDLAVLARSPLDAKGRWALAQELARQLGRDVDLVDLRQANAVLRFQAVARGERIFCSDEGAAERFEDLVFSLYCRLNEERRAILEDIRLHGSIYGR